MGRVSQRAVAALLAFAMAGGASMPLATAAPKVSAADDAKAKKLFKKGDKAYAEGDYETALAAFQEAYELSHREPLLYNLGNTYERLGKPAEAADALEHYLPHAKKAEKEILDKRIENLKKRAKDEAAAKAKAEQAERAEQAEKTDKAKHDVPAPAPTKTPERSNTLAYVLLGVGFVGVGTGTFFGLKALGARSDAEADCKGSVCSAAAKDALDRDKTYSLLTDVSFGIGLVSAGVGSYLLLSGDHAENPSEARWDVRGSAHSRGGEVQLVGKF